MKLKGYNFYSILMYNAQLVKSLITIQNELIDIITLITMQHIWLQFRNLVNYLMLTTSHHMTH